MEGDDDQYKTIHRSLLLGSSIHGLGNVDLHRTPDSIRTPAHRRGEVVGMMHHELTCLAVDLLSIPLLILAAYACYPFLVEANEALKELDKSILDARAKRDR